MCPGANPDNPKVLLAAPTGKAAYLIKGNTLHSLFSIPANQGFNYVPLTSDKLNSIRSKFSEVRLIIIDEISMVGSRMFSYINLRLQQIMGSSRIFGGISVLAVGDLFQLKPVFDNWIFKNASDAYGPLAANLWTDNFTMFELSKIMRQKDSLQFAALLNRLRENKHLPSDVEFLKPRLIQTDLNHPQYPLAIPHIYLTRKQVETHNSIVCDQQPQKKISSTAFDVVLGDVTTDVKESILARIPKDASKTMNLSTQLNTAIGLRSELTCNVDVEDGMANGAPCTVMAVGSKDKTRRYTLLWVKFEDHTIGAKCRQENKSFYHKHIDSSWTPLLRIKRQFPVGRHKSAHVMREQFPIRCAAAKTLHRCQGDTLKDVVVDFSGKQFPHSHYVALSRVTSVDNLSIRDLNIATLKVDRDVVVEMQRLREVHLLLPSPFLESVGLKVLYQNVRSLKKHMQHILHDQVYIQSDILIFSETRLKTVDISSHYSIPGFTIHRFDSSVCNNYGMVVYIRQDKFIKTSGTVKSEGNNYAEMVSFQLKTSDNLPCITVVGLYVSPKTSLKYLKHFLQHLHDHLMDHNAPFVIVGDLNIDLLNVERHFIMDILQCTQMICQETTDFHSLLDLVLLSTHIHPQEVKCGVIESFFSDHKAVYLTFN